MDLKIPNHFTQDPFIGRDDEITLYKKWLADSNAPHILYFYDAATDPEKKGGVGKTRLLQRCMEITKTEYKEEILIASIDFFRIADRNGQKIAERVYSQLKKSYPDWSADSFGRALTEQQQLTEKGDTQSANLPERKKSLTQALQYDLQELDAYLDQMYPTRHCALVLVLDTFEVIQDNPSVAIFSPTQTFPDNYNFRRIRFLMAGRHAINWEQPNWQRREHEVQEVALSSFNLSETVLYMTSWQIPLALDSLPAVALRELTDGRPILLALVKDLVGQNLVTLDKLLSVRRDKFEEYLVSRLSDLDELNRWILLFMAHAYHRFNTSLLKWMLECANLAVLVDMKDRMRLEALPHLSFVRRAIDESGDFTFHDEMRSLIVRYAWQYQDPEKDLRREISRCVIQYYERELEHEHDELARQTYVVQILYHKAFVNASDGLQYFLQHFRQAISLWQNAYARTLLQEVQKFTEDLSAYQRADLVMEEARLLLKEEKRETALAYYTQLLAEAEKNWTADHQAEIFYDLGECYLAINQFQQAVEQFDKALVLERARNNRKKVADVQNACGYIARRQGDYRQAVTKCQESISLYKELYAELSKQPEYRQELPELQRELADTHTNLSVAYRLLGEINKALLHCQKGLQIREGLTRNNEGSETAVGLSHSTLGYIYLYDGKLAEAEKHLHSALTIFTRASNKGGLATCHNGLGLIQIRRGKLEEALKHFRIAFENASHINEEAQITSLSRQGHALALLGKDEDARGLFEYAIALASSVGSSYQEVQARMGLTRVLARLGSRKQSSQQLMQAITLAEQYQYHRLLGRIEKLQGELSYQQKNYPDAFLHYAKFCHIMAGYHSIEYQDALHFLSDELLKVEDPREAAQALQSLRTYWQTQQLAKDYPEFLQACDDASEVIL